jgi:NTP pyrophosphatase (non-canonical NTP hydrolase)
MSVGTNGGTVGFYDMTRYQDDALRTEASTSPETLSRLVRAYEMFSEFVRQQKDDGEVLDRVKKYVFYGVDDDELIEQMIMPTYPTGDKKERIQQCARLFHALIGIMSDLGELCENVDNYIENGGQFNYKNLIEEGGDILWFLNLLCSFAKIDVPKMAAINISKLKSRFPHKFTVESYSNRNLAKESAAMDSPAREE